MINLIRNEFTKLFKRKNILIMFLVIISFVFLVNILNKFANNSVHYSYSYVDETWISDYEEKIKTLNPNNPSDVREYINLKTEIDTAKLIQKYSYDSWQANIITSIVRNQIENLYDYKYSNSDYNEKIYKEKEQELESLKAKLDSNDWKYFVEQEKLMYEKTIEELKATKEITADKVTKEELEENIKYNIINLEVVNYRLDKNIDYSESYLNNALQEYSSYKFQLINYDGNNDLTREDDIQIQQAQAQAALAKYTLDNEQDINNAENSRGLLLNFNSMYLFVILFAILMIAGGIVADEFSKGTIKLLLVKPYSRVKILAAKYITSILMIFITIIIVLLLQLIVGGIFFGFDSLSIPAVVYNFGTSQIQTFSIPIMIIIRIIESLPMLLLLTTLAFALSTIFTSSALAIALPLVGAFVSDLINMFALAYNIKFLRYFVTLNWDLSEFTFGRIPSYQYTSLPFAIFICSIYLIIMLVVTFIVFKKKNIKNI